jgi:hypothetical protein
VSAPPAPKGAVALEPLVSLAETTGFNDGEYARLHITLVRTVPDDQWDRVMTSCLSGDDAGPSLRFSYGSAESLLPSLPSGVPQPTAEAVERCALQYPRQSLVTKLRSRDQWSYQYDYLENTLTPCLRGRGFDVAPLPSRLVFISDGLRQQGTPGPWDQVHVDLASARGKALLAACPPTAPGF